MGWCSGTEVFDSVTDSVIRCYDQGYINIIAVTYIINGLIKALEDQDWDCQSDSQFYNHPIVCSCFKVIHPKWFEDAP